jgi:NAD(P)-dependent dehydrogenase (short-subunit alcohol dehydrogenase family)
MNDYIEKLFSLQDKATIVAGSPRGTGAKITHGLFKAWATIACIARSSEPERKLPQANYRQCNILNFKAFEKLCEGARHQFGRINILVNSVVIFLVITEKVNRNELFNQMLSMNLSSIYRCCGTTAKFMELAAGIDYKYN